MGTLYIVATPIGHLEDITLRAIQVLKKVDCIAAEDTRHSLKLLNFYGIQNNVVAYHEHNERQQAPKLLKALLAGQNIALISDAGTPLVSDPGYILVREARNHHIPIVPIPGPCAAIAALSASGIPANKFTFEGFLPPKRNQRRKRLSELFAERRTLIFYESCHRIVESLKDMAEYLGVHRQATVIRELTKIHETILSDTLGKLADKIQQDKNEQKGEFVVIVEGNSSEVSDEQEGERIVDILLGECTPKQAAMFAAKITGLKKNRLYPYAIRRYSKGFESSP